MILQKQKEKQNMSIEYNDIQNNKEEINYDINNNDNNKDEENDIEILFNESINSLFFKDTNDKNKIDEGNKKINNERINLTTDNNSIKFFDINDTEQKNYTNVLISKDKDIFDNDDQMLYKEKYNKIYSDKIITDKKENNFSSDIVNFSSDFNKKSNFNNKSINIHEYTMESNISKESFDKTRNKTQKNSLKKNKIKCRVINFNKPMSRQKINLDENAIFNKTMENKKIYSFDINENLILSFSNTNKTNKESSDSRHLINNIKSLTILSNNKVLRNKKNKNSIERYRPIKSEDNIRLTKTSPFQNVANKSIKSKQLKSKEIKSNKLNRTTDNSNTNDNSNSKPDSHFNTNNNINNSKLSNNINANASNSVYTKKVYPQNFIMFNKDNNISDNCINNTNKNKIPVSKKSIKSFLENNNIILDNNKNDDKNNKIQKNIKNTEIKDNQNINDKIEDINDSDDEGIINEIKNFEANHENNLVENKENINMNNKKGNYNICDKSTITCHSNHSYSVIESIEVIPSMNKNNIFSYAHKKYFS